MRHWHVAPISYTSLIFYSNIVYITNILLQCLHYKPSTPGTRSGVQIYKTCQLQQNCRHVHLFPFGLLVIVLVILVWHYLFFYWTLELFRQCGIICFSIGLWNCSDSVELLVFHFSMGLWNCSDSVALLVFHCIHTTFALTEPEM